MIKKTFVKSKSCYKVTFSLPKEAAENANEVRVLGEFNEWNWDKAIAMKPTQEAYTANVELEGGRAYQFRYLIDNQTWENDWQADGYVPSPYDGINNSVVVCPKVEAVAKTNGTVTQKAAIAQTNGVKTNGATPKKKATAKKATAKKANTKAKATKTPTKKSTAKKTKSVASKMKAKGLQVIEGVGPKIEKLMNEAGLHTFKDVANANVDVLKNVLEEAGPRFKMHNPTTWPEQAKLAHDGKWNELSKLQDELKGGRR